ncbi:MAG: menaquinone biosynthesis protein [Phycisphaerae bacterium]|nr:menaquinone biosynthesis protein [Phycisphaerae bacterium]
MATHAAISPNQTNAGIQTLGVVSFLNALPLYESLIERRDVAIRPAVPSRLYDMLAAGQCEVALLPIAAYWRGRDRLSRVSDACIASHGETMTVRVFSKTPPDKIHQLHVDSDSRTSVVLARLIWLEMYGRRLELVPWNDGDAIGSVESLLLIGDKVLRGAPRGFGFEVDLGAAWKHLTGLPFVFAAWYGDKDTDHTALAATLEAARDAGVAAVRRIAAEHAPRRGCQMDVAVTYLRDTMRYALSNDMRMAMDRFFHLACEHELLP